MSIREQLRERLVKRLRQMWAVNPDDLTSKIRPEVIEGHLREVGSHGVPDDIADEVLDTLDEDHQGFVQTDELDDAPAIVKLRPRGFAEDDWTARPTRNRPWPVVLVHGTGSTNGDFQELAAELRADGWAVFVPSYGTRATRPIAESASLIDAYLAQVLAATGAEKLIVVGHSQGGLVLRHWMRFLGGADKVAHVVQLSVPNMGTTVGGIASPVLKSRWSEDIALRVAEMVVGPVVHEMLVGSDYITALNEGPLLEDGVTYTCIATRSDSLVQPADSGFLRAPADDPARVHNMWVQDLEPHAVVLHENMPHDKRVRRLVIAALRRAAA